VTLEMKKDKLEEEIKELHIKSLNRVYITYGTFRRFVDKIKLSQRKEDIEMFEKILNEDEIYPKDIFPEITKKELEEIHNCLVLEFEFPLDRLSAHIGRVLLNGLKQKLKEMK
jgi:hypothetical protein